MLELAVDPTVVGVMRRREARSSHALPNLSLTQDVVCPPPSPLSLSLIRRHDLALCLAE